MTSQMIKHPKRHMQPKNTQISLWLTQSDQSLCCALYVQLVNFLLPLVGFVMQWHKTWLTIGKYSTCCLRSLSSLSEYLASDVKKSTGPFDTCCFIASYKVNNVSPAHSWKNCKKFISNKQTVKRRINTNVANSQGPVVRKLIIGSLVDVNVLLKF